MTVFTALCLNGVFHGTGQHHVDIKPASDLPIALKVFDISKYKTGKTELTCPVLVALRTAIHHMQYGHKSLYRHHAHASHGHEDPTLHPLRQHRPHTDLQLLLFLCFPLPMLPVIVLLGTRRQPQRQRLLHGSSSRRGNFLRLLCDRVYHGLDFLDSSRLSRVEFTDGP